MLVYRAIATGLLAVITWGFTGSVGDTTAITLTFTVAATAAYYLHERVWNNIKWGIDAEKRA